MIRRRASLPGGTPACRLRVRRWRTSSTPSPGSGPRSGLPLPEDERSAAGRDRLRRGHAAPGHQRRAGDRRPLAAGPVHRQRGPAVAVDHRRVLRRHAAVRAGAASRGARRGGRPHAGPRVQRHSSAPADLPGRFPCPARGRHPGLRVEGAHAPRQDRGLRWPVGPRRVHQPQRDRAGSSNYELDVALEDARFAGQMEKMFLADLENATELVLLRKAPPQRRAAPRPQRMPGGCAAARGGPRRELSGWATPSPPPSASGGRWRAASDGRCCSVGWRSWRSRCSGRCFLACSGSRWPWCSAGSLSPCSGRRGGCGDLRRRRARPRFRACTTEARRSLPPRPRARRRPSAATRRAEAGAEAGTTRRAVAPASVFPTVRWRSEPVRAASASLAESFQGGAHASSATSLATGGGSGRARPRRRRQAPRDGRSDCRPREGGEVGGTQGAGDSRRG